MAYFDRFTKKPANPRDDLRDDTQTRRPARDGRPPLPKAPGEKPGGRFASGDKRRISSPRGRSEAQFSREQDRAPQDAHGRAPQGQGRFAPQAQGQGRFAPQAQGRGRFGAPQPGQGRFAPQAQPPRAPRPVYKAQPAAPAEEPQQENLLVGRNPIREALKSGRDLEKLLVAKGEIMGSGREIIAMAREQKVIVQEVDRAKLDQMAPGHQGMIAVASAYRYSTIDDMLALAASRGEPPFLVVLDGITDPHNLGAIIRSAECAGAHGVIVPERRAVGLTPAAVKASAGAVEYIPVSRETNLTRTLERLKRAGVWIFGADMDGADYRKADFSCPAALVIGAEGEGLSRLVRESCDMIVSLPVRGKIDSLNASVAAGVLLYAMAAARD